MTKQDLLKQIESLSDEQFTRLSPYLEADIQAGDNLSALRNEITAGRYSASAQPLPPADDVYDHVRRKLSS